MVNELTENILEYREFTGAALCSINAKLEGRATAVVEQIIKTNDRVLDAVLFPDLHRELMPTLYLNDFYESYKNGVSISSITDEIIRVIFSEADKMPQEILELEDFETACKNLTFRLVNTKLNEKMLLETPHIPFLDLSIVFYCTVVTGTGDVLSAKVSNELMKNWNTDIETLYGVAKENTGEMFGISIRNVSDVINELTDLLSESRETTDFADILQDETAEYANADCQKTTDMFSTPMYIMSNRRRHFGACSILYSDILGKFADRIGDNLYVIPSSVHEVILIPVNCGRKSDLDIMVNEVNRSELEIEDVLSDHTYIFDRMLRKIRI